MLAPGYLQGAVTRHSLASDVFLKNDGISIEKARKRRNDALSTEASSCWGDSILADNLAPAIIPFGGSAPGLEASLRACGFALAVLPPPEHPLNAPFHCALKSGVFQPQRGVFYSQSGEAKMIYLTVNNDTPTRQNPATNVAGFCRVGVSLFTVFECRGYRARSSHPP